MNRKIYETLLNWKRTSNGKSAIMLDGARRVGKSYIAEEFAKREYAAYLIVENVVAQMLRAAGHKLYFYSKDDRNNAANRMEIDFLVARSRTQPKKNISPIEVKSGRKYSTVSLDKFRAKFNPFLDTPYVLHKKDVTVQDGVVYLPLYMAPLLVGRT